jgi:hypothetical protein
MRTDMSRRPLYIKMLCYFQFVYGVETSRRKFNISMVITLTEAFKIMSDYFKKKFAKDITYFTYNGVNYRDKFATQKLLNIQP